MVRAAPFRGVWRSVRLCQALCYLGKGALLELLDLEVVLRISNSARLGERFPGQLNDCPETQVRGVECVRAAVPGCEGVAAYLVESIEDRVRQKPPSGRQETASGVRCPACTARDFSFKEVNGTAGTLSILRVLDDQRATRLA